MTAAAVNCLVKEARRKFVCASIRCWVRRSVTPYPRRKAGLPLWTTRTAAPGASVDFRESKIASILVEETWAGALPENKASADSSAILSLVFNASPRLSLSNSHDRHH